GPDRLEQTDGTAPVEPGQRPEVRHEVDGAHREPFRCISMARMRDPNGAVGRGSMRTSTTTGPSMATASRKAGTTSHSRSTRMAFPRMPGAMAAKLHCGNCAG